MCWQVLGFKLCKATTTTQYALFPKYDYKKALCNDPELICGWFALVQNTIAKYGVAESDIYDFDETGFMMGIISTGMVVTNAD